MKKPQLFLIPFAGGNSYSYQFLTSYLKEFSVNTIELPGRGKRMNEVLLNNMSSAGQDIFNQILEKLDGSNFMIYGHSLGAILALKVTSMLEHINKSPSYLFLSGHNGPTNKNWGNSTSLLDDNELIKKLIKFGGVPNDVIEDNDFLDFYLPILRADFRVAHTKTDFERINVPIFVMYGSSDPDTDPNNISNWRSFTKSSIQFQLFEGGHFYIHKYPKEIASIIAKTYDNLS